MKNKVSEEEGNRRLLVLAEHLLKVPAKNFDFSQWTELKVNYPPSTTRGRYITCLLKKIMDLPESTQAQSCGTTACALGWAATIPEFNELGLNLNECGYPATSDYPGNSPTDAAIEFFGLSYDEANFLFVPNYAYDGHTAPSALASASDLAEHIKSFVHRR